MVNETSDYMVRGMTCSHCMAAVRSEIEQIAGVTAVDVELETGAVTVTSTTLVPAESISAAVQEAGYEVVP